MPESLAEEGRFSPLVEPFDNRHCSGAPIFLESCSAPYGAGEPFRRCSELWMMQCSCAALYPLWWRQRNVTNTTECSYQHVSKGKSPSRSALAQSALPSFTMYDNIFYPHTNPGRRPENRPCNRLVSRKYMYKIFVQRSSMSKANLSRRPVFAISLCEFLHAITKMFELGPIR